MNNQTLLLVLTIVLCLAGQVFAADANDHSHHHDHEHLRPDSRAPLGVMGDHLHEKGGWMVSYSYMPMLMSGNRSGTNGISLTDVLTQFPVAPEKMRMDMHMLGGMYAPTEWLTLMTMFPVLANTMDHTTRAGASFQTTATGPGDLQLSALMRAWQRGPHIVTGNFGLSVPTGSINKRDDTPLGFQKLPYPMQLGSGTVDWRPAVNYAALFPRWSIGSQAGANIRFHKNTNAYRLGNQYHLTGWAARKWARWVSSSVRVSGRRWGNIAGADSDLNAAIVPTADPKLRSGWEIDTHVGTNFLIGKGTLKGNRITVEAGLPVFRSLAGPQLENDFQIVAGWSFER